MSLLDRLLVERAPLAESYRMGDKQMVDWALGTLRLLGDESKQPVPMYVLRRLAQLAKASPKFDKD